MAEKSELVLEKFENENFIEILTNLEATGSGILKLKLKKSEGFKGQIHQLLNSVNNVETLIFEDLKFMKNHDQPKLKLKVAHLKSLELSAIENVGIMQDVFLEMNYLRHLKLANIEAGKWALFQPILLCQKQIRSLELNQIVIDSFEWKEWDLEKLVFSGVKFPQKEAFASFTRFIKTQSKLEDLKADIVTDSQENQNNYLEALMHLLALETLSKLDINFDDFRDKNLKPLAINNPNVKTLTIRKGIKNYTKMLRFFPEIEELIINAEFVCSSIGMNSHEISLKSLKTVKVDCMTPYDVVKIKSPQLRELTIENLQLYWYGSPFHYKSFAQNNPSLERLELGLDPTYFREGLQVKQLEALIQNFQNLKCFKFSLEIYENILSLVDVICENLDKVQEVEMKLWNVSEAEEAKTYCDGKYPDLKCDLEIVKTDKRAAGRIVFSKI
jgi:hypothetical protein